MEILPDFVELQAQFWGRIDAWREDWALYLTALILIFMAAALFWWRTEGRAG